MQSTGFTGLYLFHDRDETPGDLLKLEQIITGIQPVECERPDMATVLQKSLKSGSLVVGVGFGGLFAAHLQEKFPELRLGVVALNSPTSQEGIFVKIKPENRVAVYSSEYSPIQGRCNWGQYAIALDLPLLQHGVYLHQFMLGNAIAKYLRGNFDIWEEKRKHFSGE